MLAQSQREIVQFDSGGVRLHRRRGGIGRQVRQIRVDHALERGDRRSGEARAAFEALAAVSHRHRARGFEPRAAQGEREVDRLAVGAGEQVRERREVSGERERRALRITLDVDLHRGARAGRDASGEGDARPGADHAVVG